MMQINNHFDAKEAGSVASVQGDLDGIRYSIQAVKMHVM